MTHLRIAALLAVPAALSLAACGGGSSVVGNPVSTLGQHSNIRFVNGAPDLGNIDFYFQPTGAGAPSSPASTTTANIAYAVVTPFIQESPTAGSVLVRAAGSSSSSTVLDSLSCPIPQMVLDQNYTVVISGVGSGQSSLRAVPGRRVHDRAAVPRAQRRARRAAGARVQHGPDRNAARFASPVQRRAGREPRRRRRSDAGSDICAGEPRRAHWQPDESDVRDRTEQHRNDVHRDRHTARRPRCSRRAARTSPTRPER